MFEVPLWSSELTRTWRECVMDTARSRKDEVVLRSISVSSAIRSIDARISHLNIDIPPFNLPQLTKEVVQAWESITLDILSRDEEYVIAGSKMLLMEDVYFRLVESEEAAGEIAKLTEEKASLVRHLSIIDLSLSLSINNDVNFAIPEHDGGLFSDMSNISKDRIKMLSDIVIISISNSKSISISNITDAFRVGNKRIQLGHIWARVASKTINSDGKRVSDNTIRASFAETHNPFYDPEMDAESASHGRLFASGDSVETFASRLLPFVVLTRMGVRL